MMSTSTTIFLALLFGSLASTSAFAVSSSRSPKKKRVTNQKKGAGGFGKSSPDAVPVSHTPDASPETHNLLDFLLRFKSEGLGGPDAGTEVGYSTGTNGGMRGMYATRPFKENEIMCKIPSDCALALSNPDLLGDDALTMADGGLNFLRWYADNEQARQTWAAYLDTLPTRDANFDPTPDFYSDEEIQALEFPLAIRLAKERKAQVSELAEREGISLEELQFATWLVASRSFVISISVDDPNPGQGAVASEKKAIRVLLPYLDMINHSSDNANAELHLIDPEKDEAWFAIRATRPIKEGKEITISYGATGVESSVELLTNYGFVPDENKIDTLMLRKGGEECIASLDGWTTTLEEDEKALEDGGDKLGNMRNVLSFRTKLKRSYK